MSDKDQLNAGIDWADTVLEIISIRYPGAEMYDTPAFEAVVAAHRVLDGIWTEAQARSFLQERPQ